MATEPKHAPSTVEARRKERERRAQKLWDEGRAERYLLLMEQAPKLKAHNALMALLKAAKGRDRARSPHGAWLDDLDAAIHLAEEALK